MVLNTNTVLLGFVGALRLLLGLLILGIGLATWRDRTRPQAVDERDVLEDRGSLVLLMALLLTALNLASWPLLYLLLQSYVPEWPGVMCVYGVMQVGTGTTGPSRFLPDLLRLLQLTRPALVFAGGAWFVLYVVNRRARSAPLLRRLFLLLLPFAALATVDAAAELAYVAIPKKEAVPAGGCCTGLVADEWAGHALRVPGAGEAARPWLIAGYYATNLLLVAALAAAARPARRTLVPWTLTGLAFAGAAAFVISAMFLVEVAVPTLLRLPYHRCPYDLIPEAPDAVAAVALYVAGAACLGWAVVVRWLGADVRTEPVLAGTVRGLLQLGLWAYVVSVAMLSFELILA